MTVPLIVLAGLSIVGGVLNLPKIETLAHWLEHTIHEAKVVEFSPLIAGLSVAVALAGILFAWFFYGRKPIHARQIDPLRKILGPLFTAFERKWWIDELYDVLFLTPYKDISEVMAKPVDAGLVDGMVNGSGKLTAAFSRGFRKLQSGMVRTYALYMLLGVAAILGYLILR
jgi:NADH-quinone oxidoreductase subunit L